MSVDEVLQRREPIIYLVTLEESRAEAEIRRHCEGQHPPLPLYRWSCTRGMEKLQGGVMDAVRVPDHGDARHQSPLVPVLNYILHECKDDGIFLLKDVHHFLRGGTSSFNPTMALTTRALRDTFHELRNLGKRRKIVLMAPELVVPPDLEKELRIHDYRLPTREELATTVRSMLRRAEAIKQKDSTFTFDVDPTDAFVNALVDAAVGLTQLEVEYVLENMLYAQRRLTSDAPRRMVKEKQQIIRRSQVLEYIPAEDLEGLEVGGLDTMLRWLQLRKHVFENREKARDQYGIKEVPRGVLLVGISGCGKSLVCKKIAHEWGCPLLRLDVGAVFDKWVGSSEDRIRNALRVAESVAPCILWVDEIEKGFSSGAGGDGGTSSRVLGTFLVWMQEKKSPVFIAATANDITALPAELLRSGRFDNRFFVGCPGEQSRREIFSIHLRAHKLDPQAFDLDTLVQMTLGFTGAEIEQAVVDSTFDAFFEDRRATMEDLIRNIQRCHPLVKSLRPQIEKILEMLENGRMELASEDTVSVTQLVDGLGISMRR